MIGYFWDDFVPKSFFWHKNSNSNKNFCNHSKRTKKYLYKILQGNVIEFINYKIIEFYRVVPIDWTALHPVLSQQTTFYKSKVDHLLILKCFHEKTNENFVRELKLV